MIQVRLVCALMPAIMLSASPALAESAAPQPMPVALMDCIETALRQNLGLAVRRHDVALGRTHADVERARFDPALFLGGYYERTDRQASVAEGLLPPFNPTSSLDPRERSRVLEGGMETYLPTGTTLRAQTGHVRRSGNRLSALADGAGISGVADYLSEYTLTLDQELLRDFGPAANLTGLYVAQIDAEKDWETYREDVLRITAEVERAYWQLVLLEDVLENAYLSLDMARDLLERNEIRVDVGVAAPLEVTVSQAEVSRRAEFVIQAERALHDGRDVLYRLMGLSREDPLWATGVSPVERPVHRDVALDEDRAVDAALLHRPDVARLERDITTASIELGHASNQRLPRLTASAAATTSGNERHSQSRSNNTATDFDYVDYGVGLRFHYPLHNRAANARHDAATLRLDQRRAQRDDLEQLIRVEVREAIRQVTAAAAAVEAASATVRAEAARLEAERLSYEEGLSTSRRVLEAQEDLVSARTRRSQAQVGYISALVDLEERKGTLLGAHGITLDRDGVAHRQETDADDPEGWGG